MACETNASGRVALISMPWGTPLEPNLGLGILKSVLRRAGIDCDIFETIPRMLRWMKYESYDRYSATWGLNDFLFTHEFEPQISPKQLEAARRIITDDQDLVRGYQFKIQPVDEEMEKVTKLRQEIVPAFLDDLMEWIDFERYCMVGFTCLFDQTWASLALANRIKSQFPWLPIAFGGYAVDKPAGPALQAVMPQMDIVAYGDGEPTIVPLVEACRGLRPFSEVPNISYRDNGEVRYSEVPPVKIDLADSPVPNYDDWFRAREELKSKYKITVPVGEMPLESSRGCWWGQKHHCTFCGIDEVALAYRKKPVQVVVDQLEALNERYGTRTFRFSDYIMPMSHFSDFLHVMANRGAPYWLHYETKANLTPEQVQLAARAGIYYLQPGIESFSTPVLKAMDKGVTGIQNISVLYHMMKNNIYCYYNLIFGFPGDRSTDYWDMVKKIPLLYHLLAPGSITYPMVVRHAPLQVNPRRFGAATDETVPHWRYDVMFSNEYLRQHPIPFDDYVYYFSVPDPYRTFDEDALAAFKALQHQSILWAERYEYDRVQLSYEINEDRLKFFDTRYGKDPETVEFRGMAYTALYELLTQKVWSTKRLLAAAAERNINEALCRTILNEFVEARVLYQEDSLYTGIAFESWYYESEPGLHRWWSDKATVDAMKNSPPVSLPNDPMFGMRDVDRPTGVVVLS